MISFKFAAWQHNFVGNQICLAETDSARQLTPVPDWIWPNAVGGTKKNRNERARDMQSGRPKVARSRTPRCADWLPFLPKELKAKCKSLYLEYSGNKRELGICPTCNRRLQSLRWCCWDGFLLGLVRYFGSKLLVLMGSFRSNSPRWMRLRSLYYHRCCHVCRKSG